MQISINKEGNRLYLDYGREAINWLYSTGDVEIGLSADKKISYVAIELTGLAKPVIKALEKAIKKGEKDE